MWFTFPDTKGRPLEEVAAIFGDEGETYLPIVARLATD